MTVDGHTLDFTYDSSGRPLSVTYDGTPYFYVLSLQGDVMAILDSSGTAVVSYTYSAYGSSTYFSGSMRDTLGYYNPLRYRGYVYDPEYGLYYLQSRYYNTGLSRFNAPDAFASTGQGILGNNMFAYCRNNPVSRRDVAGTFDKEAYDSDGDPTSDENDHRGMRASTGSGTIHTSALSTFKTAIKDAADGLKLAAGQRDMTHFEQHHIVSNKSKVYTPSYKEITDRYNMSLESEHNIVNLPGHRGRHTNRYHDFVLFCLEELDAIANGSSDVFYEGFQIIADLFFDFPLLPYAR